MKQLLQYVLYLLLTGFILGNLQAQDEAGTGFAGQASLLGNSGLVFTPSAYLAPDRTVSFGGSYVPSEFSRIRYENEQGDKIFFANIGFLPFLETTIRLIKPVGSKNNYGIGDRSVLAKLQISREGTWIPTVALGFHDLFGTRLHRNAYLVASKTMQDRQGRSLGVNIGYGYNFENGETTYLEGFFGGLAARWDRVTFVVEYDAVKINSGIKLSLFDGALNLNAFLLDMRGISGGISYRLRM